MSSTTMQYRHRADIVYEHGERQNESRADLGEAMLVVGTDRNAQDAVGDVELDVSDAIANLIHFCARVGLDFDAVVEKAQAAAEGDLEDGPEAARDTERFPA